MNFNFQISSPQATRKQIQKAFVFQTTALIVFAWIFRHALNPDAVAYLQLAHHYAAGNVGLAISGYWSPLISWIIVPLLKLGLPPLAAARLLMILSAVFFLYGSLRLFQQFELSGPMLICGLRVMALLSIPWSVENITPDLLLGGFVGLAFSKMITPQWFQKSGLAFWCGTIWGLAYLCKSVALPLGILTTTGMAIGWWKNKRSHHQAQIGRALSMTLMGMLIVAGVWIGILTNHYGRFTFANAAAYNHSLVGPKTHKHLFLLDSGIKAPPPGRITIWEDPWSPYPNWSPLSSWTNAKLQLKIILKNAATVSIMLTGVGLIFPVLVVLVIMRLFHHNDGNHGEQNQWLALMPVLILVVFFLPGYLLVTEQRYFYCTAPLLYVAASQCGQLKKRFVVLLVISFIVPTLAREGLYLNSTRTAGECANVLAKKMSQKHLVGPVVGSGKLHGGRTGLYVAYLLQQPWLGDEPSPSAADYKASGASLIVVNRTSVVATQLAADKNVRNLDSELLGTQDNAKKFPIQVFQITSP
jgi:hypothetical protein